MEHLRAELRELETSLLNIWVDVIAAQPVFAEHLRTAARSTHNAVMALDASVGADVIDLRYDDVIDLRAGRREVDH